MRDKQIKIIVYHRSICKMGGVETFIFNFCRTFRELYDITVMYEQCDLQQITRIAQYVNVEQIDYKKTYHADVVVNNTASWVKFPKNITADKIYTVIHCDYKDYMKFGVNPMLNEGHQFICVNKFARDSYVNLFHCDCDVIEGTLQPDFKPNRILHLISATRLSVEKGKNRMYTLMRILKSHGIKFDWQIYTNDPFELSAEYPEVTVKTPRYDIIDYIADADYLVQLSDTEALCYAVREALSVGTPVIVTDIPGFDYIENGKLGYKVDLNMSNVNVDKIYNEIPKVHWTEDKKAIVEEWFKRLGEPVKVEKPVLDKNEMVKIKILVDYSDVVLHKFITKGTIMEVTRERAFVLSHTDGSRPIIAEILKEA